MKILMIKGMLFLSGLIIIGCENNKTNYNIQIHGALRDIMHNGVREGIIHIADAVRDNHIYGVGALEGLDGEILLWDSKVILTRADKQGEVTVSNNAENEKGLLLVTAKIDEWIEIPFNGKKIGKSLDDYIYEMANNNNIKLEEPFPFILEGIFSKVKWHIISDPGLDGSHNDHMNKSWNQTDEKTEAKILGFYSTKHHAIFTHHTTNSHMHYYDENTGLSGHVDDLILSEYTVLKLPK